MPKTQITFSLDPERTSILRRAFPGQADDKVALAMATLATNEMIDLLGGKKRYLSLSHQYIEWIQQIYETLLPQEEFTYRRIFDGFNFPPGAAAYIARVLRARQNTALNAKAKNGLTAKCNAQIKEYDRLPPNEQPPARMRTLRLAAREYDLLQLAIDTLLQREEPLDPPNPTSRTREFVNVSLHVDTLRKAVPEIANL